MWACFDIEAQRLYIEHKWSLTDAWRASRSKREIAQFNVNGEAPARAELLPGCAFSRLFLKIDCDDRDLPIRWSSLRCALKPKVPEGQARAQLRSISLWQRQFDPRRSNDHSNVMIRGVLLDLAGVI